MKSNRGRDTGPELRLRSAAHRLGLRFRVSRRPVPAVRRTADLVFPGQRIAVFVDGCFWHGCPEHYTRPVANADFWADKVEANSARDRDTDQKLRDEGWTVIRFWEHEDPEACAGALRAVVEAIRAGAHHERRRPTPED